MTTRIYFASNSLGHVTEHSLQKALDYFNLGVLVQFQRTAKRRDGANLVYSNYARRVYSEGQSVIQRTVSGRNNFRRATGGSHYRPCPCSLSDSGRHAATRLELRNHAQVAWRPSI